MATVAKFRVHILPRGTNICDFTELNTHLVHCDLNCVQIGSDNICVHTCGFSNSSEWQNLVICKDV